MLVPMGSMWTKPSFRNGGVGEIIRYWPKRIRQSKVIAEKAADAWNFPTVGCFIIVCVESLILFKEELPP